MFIFLCSSQFFVQDQERTDIVVKVPTTFDETIPINGKVGEYVALARKKRDTWFAAAMTNWTPQDLTLDLAFLPAGNYRAEIFQDGVNADRDGTDYKKKLCKFLAKKLNIHLAPGGGRAARFEQEK